MIHNLKILGIAIVAALALGAVMASAAMAVPQFTASSYPATLTGSNAKGNEVFTTEGGKVECNSHFEGSLSAASSSLTLHPTYTSCEAFGFLSATVTTTGCHEVLHHTRKLSSGKWLSHIDVVCTPSAPSPPSYKVAASTCEVEIKPQTGLGSVEVTNSGSSILLTRSVGGIAYTVTKDGFLCPFGGTGNKTGGTYTGAVTLSRVGGGSVSGSGE